MARIKYESQDNLRQEKNVLGHMSRLWDVSYSKLPLDYKLDYVDICQNDFNISVDNLRRKLISSRSHNTLPDILVVIHLGGVLQDMKEIYRNH